MERPSRCCLCVGARMSISRWTSIHQKGAEEVSHDECWWAQGYVEERLMNPKKRGPPIKLIKSSTML